MSTELLRLFQQNGISDEIIRKFEAKRVYSTQRFYSVGHNASEARKALAL